MTKPDTNMVWYYEVRQNGKWSQRLSSDAPRIKKEEKRFHTEPKRAPLEKMTLDEYSAKYGTHLGKEKQ